MISMSLAIHVSYYAFAAYQIMQAIENGKMIYRKGK